MVPSRALPLLLPLLVLVACDGDGEKDDTGGGSFSDGADGTDGADGADGTDGADGSDGATDCVENGTFQLSGIVRFDGSPAEGATVYLWADDVFEPVTATTDSEGAYFVEAPAGDWYLEVSTADGCYSSTDPISAAVCDDLVVDFSVSPDDCVTADKPNLYLYPKRDLPMQVEVLLGRKQRVVASDPQLPPQGWRGVAHPDGTWTAQGAKARSPFLFYEVSLAPEQLPTMQREEGWCIEARGTADAAEQMAELLGLYDFNAQERDDFVEAWRIDLPLARSYVVYPQREVGHLAGLRLRPALPVDRLWLLVEDGAGCPILTEPVIEPMDRRGAHGVEWGVVLGDLAR